MARHRPRQAYSQAQAMQALRQRAPAGLELVPGAGGKLQQVAPGFQALGTSDDATFANVSTPLRWWRPGARDAASDTLLLLPQQRGQSRELARENPIAAGAIGTNVDRVVGTGLALVAQPNRSVLGWSEDRALEWKRGVQNEFSMWADSAECDLRGEQNFYDLQRLTLRSSLESGDCFSVLPDGQPTATQPYRLRIQTIEADRIGNPDARGDQLEYSGGVRRSSVTGGASAYYVYDHHPGAYFLRGLTRYAGQWIERAGPSGRLRILHHYRVLRPEQPRGVPYLAVIADHLKQLGRYTEAEIVAAVATANIMMTIEVPAGNSMAPVFGATDALTAQSPEIAMAAGAVLGLAPGEKASLVDPSRPNVAFQAFILAIIQQIGVGLGIPFELLVKQFNSSYSASKAALLDAWMRFRSERVWLARSFCQPIYETWLAEAVASRRIAAPGFFSNPLMRWAYTRAAWHGDSQGSINPKDEVDAYSAAVEARFMTRERAEWELFGTDWYETYDAKKTEQARLNADDLLPVPRAGAPAPSPEGPSGTTERPDAGTSALHEALITALARDPAPPQVTVNVEPAQVEIHQGDMQITLPETTVQLEAHIEQPSVLVQPANVHVDVAPTPFNVTVETPSSSTRQVITRDADGEIAEIVTSPVITTPSKD